MGRTRSLTPRRLIEGFSTQVMGSHPPAAADGTIAALRRYTAGAVAAIALSALLGLLVSVSTFLLIGATSALTYNVCGCVYLKT